MTRRLHAAGRSLVVLSVCIAQVAVGHAARAAEQTAIALTATIRPQAPKEDQELAENLLMLVELGVQSDRTLSVVERRQIDLVIQELVLNQSRSAGSQLQLGKLVTADVLAMIELLEPAKNSPKRWGMLRLVDAKTAAIRGVTVASLDGATLEETAEQFSRYISAVNRAPQEPTVTVAVAPFKSQGRFDRLRPLELGIRDLITVRLLRLSGTSSKGAEDEVGKPVRFQVLARSNLEQLVREIDLIQSGLSDKSRLPRTLPTREASYLVRGDVDERQVDGKYAVVVRGEIVNAATAQIKESFKFECLPAELEEHLSRETDQLVERVLHGAPAPNLERTSKGIEVESLEDLAMQDLRRFRRISPLDFSFREFQLPGENTSRGIPRLVKPETPLGQHLLRKSIDRLESILYIRPDDARAAYALGFCYSLHADGIYRPDRADELLRKAYSLKPQAELAALALAFLAETAFHDQTGQMDEDQRTKTAERLWFAFEHMPEEFRDHRWPRLLDLLGGLYRRPEQHVALAKLLEKAVPYAEQADVKHRRQLCGAVQSLAMRLAKQATNQPELKAKGMDLLHRWAEGPDKQLADFGRQGLAAISAGNKDFLGAAIQYEESAAMIIDSKSAVDRHTRDWQLVQAAKNYRLAKQPDRALRLLLPFEPKTMLQSLLAGHHGYEVGACYAALGEPQKALQAYLRATEKCPLIVANTDIVARISALGGVPLRADRDVDVRYLLGPDKKTAFGTYLATNGKRLFVSGGVGLRALDVASETFEPLKPELGQVTCLKHSDGQLWAGTDKNGLWRCDPASGTATPFGIEQGLPDPHVESLAVHERGVYVGVGTKASGGVVRIDSAGQVHICNEPLAPRVAPTHIVVTDKVLLARTLETIYEWSFETKAWSQHPVDPGAIPAITPRLFSGATAVWASNYGRELTRWEAGEQANAVFKPAWYVPANKAGYLVNFVAEQGDAVWFGGHPWEDFTSSALYRFNLKTGNFYKFTPADGFKTCDRQSIYDGLWLDGRLWLTTSHGLCVLTARDLRH